MFTIGHIVSAVPRIFPSRLCEAGYSIERACVRALSDDADDPPEAADDLILMVRVPDRP
jgi:hypothetical protein